MTRRETYERELAATVGSGTGRWPTELRLAVVGIVLGVALLWRLRPHRPALRADLDGELRELSRGLAELRTAVEAEPSPLRDLLELWAEQMDRLAEQADRIAEEAYLATDPGGVLRRLRVVDRDLTELRVELRCKLRAA